MGAAFAEASCMGMDACDDAAARSAMTTSYRRAWLHKARVRLSRREEHVLVWTCGTGR